MNMAYAHYLRDLLPDTIAIDQADTLCLAGHRLSELAQEYGTPLYIFDQNTIHNACVAYKDAFTQYYTTSTVQFLYASKAYLSPSVARLIAEEGMGLDVVSGGELLVAERAAFPMKRVSFHGNNKSTDELRLALRLGVGRIVLDNWSELERLTRVAGDMHMQPEVLVRVAPDVQTETHRYLQTGHASAKFGFPLSTGEAKAALLRILREGQLRLLGVHAHTGTMLREVRPYQECLERLFVLIEDVYEETGWWPKEISPGGGWAIATPEYLEVPPVAELARALQESMQLLLTRYAHNLPGPTLILEPGRSIIARAGIALYRIGARKETPGGVTYLFVDGGMADNIRPALYNAQYTAMVVEQVSRPCVEEVSVAGRYCESGDLLIEHVTLPYLKDEELLLLPLAGAYCLPMSSNYNLVPRPAVLFVNEQDIKVMERRETYADVLARYQN